MRIAITWSPGRITVSPTAISATPFRITETSRAPSGSASPPTRLPAAGESAVDLHLDDLEPFPAQLEQPHEPVLGHLVLDEAEDARTSRRRSA